MRDEYFISSRSTVACANRTSNTAIRRRTNISISTSTSTAMSIWTRSPPSPRGTRAHGRNAAQARRLKRTNHTRPNAGVVELTLFLEWADVAASCRGNSQKRNSHQKKGRSAKRWSGFGYESLGWAGGRMMMRPVTRACVKRERTSKTGTDWERGRVTRTFPTVWEWRCFLCFLR